MRLRDLTGETGMVRRTAADLLHGAVYATPERDGWVRPHRFSAPQERAFGSCQAWHPGLFRQMARTTAGVTLEFSTDSSEVALEVLMDPEPAGTRAILDYSLGETPESRRPHDGISADVDGRHLEVKMPEEESDFVGFSLDDPDAAPVDGLLQLPGFGDVHRVRLNLPALRGCVVRNVVGNGSFVEPVPAQPQLLVLSDSVAQGFTADDPALSWPRLLADELGLDLVNQGLGGQVFQPGSLLGLTDVLRPERIVVQLGCNYRFEPCRERDVARDIRTYLLEVARTWPSVPVWVATPLWFDEEAYESHPKSCWGQVDSLVRSFASAHENVTVVDGGVLLDHKTAFFADIYGHPNAAGSAQVALRLGVLMRACKSDLEGRACALRVLKRAPRRVFPLVEALRRGLGSVVFAQKGCVLLHLPDDIMVFWASDYDLGRTVIATLMGAKAINALEPGLVRDIGLAHALTGIRPYHLAVYQKNEPLPVDPARDIRPLGEEWLQVVRTRYSYSGFQSDEEVRQMLEAGLILGGFEDGELVGFVGEHPGGAIGMLEVFSEHRRKGWGLALESAKINQHLSQGWTPWCEVFSNHKASLKLQRKLGLKVTPSNEQCFLEPAEDVVAPGEPAEDETNEAEQQPIAKNAPDSLGRLAAELGIDLLDEIPMASGPEASVLLPETEE